MAAYNLNVKQLTGYSLSPMGGEKKQQR